MGGGVGTGSPGGLEAKSHGKPRGKGIGISTEPSPEWVAIGSPCGHRVAVCSACIIPLRRRRTSDNGVDAAGAALCTLCGAPCPTAVFVRATAAAGGDLLTPDALAELAAAAAAAPEADDDWADCRSRVVLYHVARARTFFAGVLRRRPAAAADRRRSAGDVLAELTAAAATTSDGRVGRFWYHACTGTFFALKKHYKAMRVECNQEGPCYPIWISWITFFFLMMLFGALIASAGADQTSNKRWIVKRCVEGSGIGLSIATFFLCLFMCLGD
uniref:Uncharacterized protein n=1 Tax=Oryza rufipogon TaxID=4529 RepID=A0A0E0QB97_ORYRU